MVIFAGPHVRHEIMNTGDETMKIACFHIPPIPNDYINKMIKLSHRNATKK
jgi:mannose-6-phosphate isomerase-like protein (cupin superfamily)